jgi:hypothetical protein
MNTIGIVVVAAFAASTGAVEFATKMTATWLLTRSSASDGSFGNRKFAERTSIATFWPTRNPASARPCWKAAKAPANASGLLTWRNPITGIFGCCALAASGHAAAAPPRRVMKSRRCMKLPVIL